MLKKLKSFFSAKKLMQFDEGIGLKEQGDALSNQGKFADAANCYRRAIASNQSDIEACVGLGFVLSELKQYSEAEQYLRQTLLFDPKNSDAHFILGTISQVNRDQANAIEHFRHALDISPTLEFAHRELFNALLQIGQTERAKETIERAISVFPDSAEFRFELARLYAHKKEFEKSIECYQKALSLQPDSVAAHINLADVFSESGQLEMATGSYCKALLIQPQSFEALSGLGVVNEKLMQIDIALACFQQAANLQPEHAPTQVRLGNALQMRGNDDEAIECYRRAVGLDRECAIAHQSLGNALLSQGLNADAIACFEEVVRLEPGSPVSHIVAALSGSVTDRAPSTYVEKLFDEYAEKFNSHLVKELKYSVPERLAGLLMASYVTDRKRCSILDLGCGTGLFGAAVSPIAFRLVGVDLSAKMLQKANALNLYHRLEQLDLLMMMKQETASSYDVVSAADVFIYLGKLDDLFIEAKRILRPKGLFAFSVESLEALTKAIELDKSADFLLNVTGRYAHSINYLTRMAEIYDFEILTTAEAESRIEKGKSVICYLTVWQCKKES